LKVLAITFGNCCHKRSTVRGVAERNAAQILVAVDEQPAVAGGGEGEAGGGARGDLTVEVGPAERYFGRPPVMLSGHSGPGQVGGRTQIDFAWKKTLLTESVNPPENMKSALGFAGSALKVRAKGGALVEVDRPDLEAADGDVGSQAREGSTAMLPSTCAGTPPMTESNTSGAPGLMTYPARSYHPPARTASSALLIATAFTAALPPEFDCAKVNGRKRDAVRVRSAIDTWMIGLLTSMARLSEIFRTRR